MSFTIRIPDANFGNYFMSTGYPDKEDLVNLFYFGGDATSSTINNSGDANALIIGAPLYRPNYVTVNDLDFIETSNEVSDNNSTLIIAVRRTGDNYFVAGTYTTGNETGTTLYSFQPQSTSARISASVTKDPSTPRIETGFVLNTPVDSDFIFYAISQNAGKVTVYAIVDGVISQSSVNVISQHTGKVRFGGWGRVGVRETHDIAMAGVYKKGLNSAQLNDFYTHSKSALSSRGITLK